MTSLLYHSNRKPENWKRLKSLTWAQKNIIFNIERCKSGCLKSIYIYISKITNNSRYVYITIPNVPHVCNCLSYQINKVWKIGESLFWLQRKVISIFLDRIIWSLWSLKKWHVCFKVFAFPPYQINSGALTSSPLKFEDV